MQAPINELRYAEPNIPAIRGMAWGYALASAALPFFGCFALLFLKRITFQSAGSALFVILAIFMAGSAGAIICGWVGRRAAARSRAVYAGWISVIGMAFGAALLFVFGLVFATRFVLPYVGR